MKIVKCRLCFQLYLQNVGTEKHYHMGTARRKTTLSRGWDKVTCFWLLYLTAALKSKSSLLVFHLIAYAYQCHRQTNTHTAYRADCVFGLSLCLFHEIVAALASSPPIQYSLSRNNLICCDFPHRTLSMWTTLEQSISNFVQAIQRD